MKKQHVQLKPTDRKYLEMLISQGQQSARIYRRALGLLELDRGQTYTAVSKILQVTIPTISNWAAQYAENGLKVLHDQNREGRPVEIDGNQRAKITALACSEPPEGYGRWNLHCWPTKWLNWDIVNIYPIRRWRIFSKKRTEAPSQAHLVYWEDG